MADLNQLYDALLKADAAGDEEGARTLAQYIKQVQGAGVATPPPPGPSEDTGFFDMAGRALVRGAKQTGSLLGDVLPAMVGKAIGADEYAAQQMQEAAETQAEIEQKYGARYKELSDVKGISDIIPFVTETVLEQVPNLATSIVPGVGGAMVGGKLAAQQAAKTLATRQATQAGAKYAALKAAQGAAYGGLGGAYLGSYALNAPEIFQNIYESTKDESTGEGQMEVGASLLAGSVSAALDSILPAYLVRQFTPGMKAGVVEKLLEKSGMPAGIARGVTAGVITGMATEAPTEATQEAISIAAEKFVNEHADLWNSKDFNRIVESFVRGGVGGGGISGISGGVKGYLDKRAEAKAFNEGKSGASALDQLDTDQIEGEDIPDTFYDEEGGVSALEQVGSLDRQLPPKDQAPAQLKELKAQIAEVSAAIRDLETRGADEVVLADWYTERERLQAQERALRRGEVAGETLRAPGAREEALRMAGMSEEEIQQRRVAKGEPGKTYPVTQYDQSLSLADIQGSGLRMSEAKAVADQAASGKVSGPARFILNNLLEGKFKFGNEWRVPTEQDYADANEETRAKFDRLKEISQLAPQQRLLAQQMGLNLAPATDETIRELESPIERSEQEFELTAPEGQVAPEVDIETEAAPAAAPIDLAAKDLSRLRTLFDSLVPTVQAVQGIKNYKAAIKNFLDEIQQYLEAPISVDRKENLGLINDFFNSLSLTSNKQLASGIVADLKGKTAEQQAQILAQRTKMPNLTTPAGINELRARFQDFMEQQNLAKVGEFPAAAASKTFASDIYIPKPVANLLRQLRNKPTRLMSAGEKAFMDYMSKFKYGLAMKSAAYDLANQIPMGNMFSGQGAKAAADFQQFVAENFPPQIVEAFTETVEEYKYQSKYAAEKFKRLNEMRERRKEYLRQKKAEAKEVREFLAAEKAKEETKIDELTRQIQRASYSQPAAAFKPMHPAIEQRIADGDVDGALALIERMPGAKYWQLLARRLRAANLEVTTRFDEQDRLIRFDLARISATVDKLIADIRDVYPDIYDAYIAPAIDQFSGEIDIRAFAKGLQAIKDNALLGENIANSTQINWVLERYADSAASLEAPGFYMFSKGIDVINLNKAKGGNSYYALFHELTHAATAHAIRNPDALNAAQRKALNNLKELYEYTLANYPASYEYGLRNLDEFIAEAFSNADFQRLLGRLPYKNSGSSMWSRFVDYIRRLLGGTDTVLFGTLANADILMSASQSRPAGSTKYTGTLMAGAPKTKRTSDGTFRTAPDVRLNQNWLDILKNRPTWEFAKTKVAQMIENISDTTRKHFLGAFTLRQLQDMIGTRLGLGAKNFILSVENMLEEHNKIIDEAKKITEKWSRFQADNPKENDTLSTLMIDSTLLGVDPDLQPNKDAELTKTWDSLSPEAQAIYREVRDFYERRIESYKATMLNNARLSMIASGVQEPDLSRALAKIEAEFNADLVGPYFPLRRFGQYWINIGKGPDKGFYMFDSAGARNTALAMFEQNPANADIQAENSLREASSRGLLNITALETINKTIDSTIDSVLDGTYQNARNQSPDTLRAALKDSMQELYLLTLPNKSLRKNFLHRRGVSGASQDMLRVFSETSSRMAYQHARFKFSRQMFSQLQAAKELNKSKAFEDTQQAKVDSDYLNELERRLEYVMNPSDTGKIPTILSNVSFLWYLTAPASALVNMLGLPAVGLPVLSARFGTRQTAAMLLTYGKKFMTAGFKDKDGKFSMPSVGMTEMSPEERAAYEAFVAGGLIDITQSYDLAGLAESPSNMYTGKMSTIMRWGGFMFHHAERFNREVMAMSAFKLALEKAKKEGYSGQAAFDKAVDVAKDLTYRAMFDYSTLNKPRYLQNGYAKVILQFKQFPQHMTYLLARSSYEWFSKNNPALREEVRNSLYLERRQYGLPEPANAQEFEAQIDAEVTRIVKEGRDRLLGTLGMAFLFAGATGLPLFSVGASVIEAVHAAFADDDEPPLDFENWFKNWMAKTFGDFWGDSISRGVVTQATGMNIADRMSLNDLWFRDARKSQDEVTAFQNMIINLLGPTASLGISGAEAVKLFNDGMYYRGAEKLLPAMLKQPLVGARYATEGALSLKGDELVSGSELSAKDALAQSLGFAPEKVAQRQKANIEQKAAEQDILAKRQDLLNAFFMGVDTADDDLMERVIDKIGTFNRTYPSKAIKAETLSRSVRTRYKNRALAEINGGISIDKALMADLEDMGYYGTVD